MSTAELIKRKTAELGFLDCAIIPATPLLEEVGSLNKWLNAGMHGEMSYMERNFEKRVDPQKLFENAKSIVVVLQNYYTDKCQDDPEAPIVSKYAYGDDYHKVMKDKLFLLLQYIKELVGPCNGRPFVDSAPLLERAVAKKAGLGWIGKNSNLISIHHGSFVFIGELIVDIELPFDKPRMATDHCGTCTKCIDACPTQAITEDRVVDARLCISYQTIELKGELDQNLKGKFKNRVFGCDICQDVCPWNLKSQEHDDPHLEAYPKLLELTRKEWYSMERELFNNLFRNSPVKRTGFNGLTRNMNFLKNNQLNQSNL